MIRNTSGEIEEIQELPLGEVLEKITPLSEEAINTILLCILSKENYLTFLMHHEIDTSYSNNSSTSGARYRVNCYQDTR